MKTKSSQFGQTLIETMVAVFILTMGITAATGLAVYAFGTSTGVIKQIIAVGLAREGIEAVKNMRDTNWLKLDIDNNCHSFIISASSPAAASCPGRDDEAACCYKDWQGLSSWSAPLVSRGYIIDPPGSSGTQSYRLSRTTDVSRKFWDINTESSNFGLNINKNIAASGFTDIYTPHASGPHGSSDYYREVIITENNSAPYFSTDVGPRLEVTSRVWWVDKNCPRKSPSYTYNDAKPSCRIQLQTHLTNWKDYQP